MASTRLTLTEAVFWTKRIGLLTLGGLVLIIFIRIIIGLLSGPSGSDSKYLIANNACKSEITPVTLTTLPLVENTEPTITLETPDGRLPDLPKVVNLYKYDHPGQSLNALEDATVLAESVGFPRAERRKKTDTDYTWNDIGGLRQLDLNLENLNFFLNKSDFSQGLPQPEGEPLVIPTEEEAKDIAFKWLRELGLATNNYTQENSKVYFLQVKADGSLALTSSRQNADLVRVDFLREKDFLYIESNLSEAQNLGTAIQDKLIEGKGKSETGETIDVLNYPTAIVTNNPDKGNVSLTFNGQTLTNTKGETNLWQMEYFNWRVAEKSCGTYTLIDPSEAFEKVKSGEGYLVKLQKKFGGDPFEKYTPQVVKSIVILDIELAYLDSRVKQQFLQPVYVLKGDALLGNNTKADIVFYVPALKVLYED
jgi:hypothetical protein